MFYFKKRQLLKSSYKGHYARAGAYKVQQLPTVNQSIFMLKM